MAEWMIAYSNIFDALLEGAPLEEVIIEGTFDDVILEVAKKAHKYRFAKVSVKVNEKRKKWFGLKEDNFEYFETVMILKTNFAKELLKERDGDGS